MTYIIDFFYKASNLGLKDLSEQERLFLMGQNEDFFIFCDLDLLIIASSSLFFKIYEGNSLMFNKLHPSLCICNKRKPRS